MQKLSLVLLTQISSFLEQKEYCEVFKVNHAWRVVAGLIVARTKLRVDFEHAEKALELSKDVTLVMNYPADKDGPRAVHLQLDANLDHLTLETQYLVNCFLEIGAVTIGTLTLERINCTISAVTPAIRVLEANGHSSVIDHHGCQIGSNRFTKGLRSLSMNRMVINERTLALKPEF